MKNFTARAMQISYLEKEDIEKLHSLEKSRLYILPNWNIQTLFNIQGIKEKYHLQGDDESLALHSVRIEGELRDKFKGQFKGVDEDSMDWIHGLDWAVFHRVNEIVWQHSGRVSRGSYISQVKSEQSFDVAG